MPWVPWGVVLCHAVEIIFISCRMTLQSTCIRLETDRHVFMELLGYLHRKQMGHGVVTSNYRVVRLLNPVIRHTCNPHDQETNSKAKKKKKSMADDDLEAIRARRLAELQGQYGVS